MRWMTIKNDSQRSHNILISSRFKYQLQELDEVDRVSSVSRHQKWFSQNIAASNEDSSRCNYLELRQIDLVWLMHPRLHLASSTLYAESCCYYYFVVL